MTVVVVGAGLGGLSFGACAARDGHRVILIDKNAEPGGVMTLAREGGFSFEQGPLILTDLREDEPVGAFLASLGIHLETVRDDRGLCTPDFSLLPPEDYAGPDWRQKRLEQLFPADRRGIRAYYRFYDALMELRFLSGRRKTPLNRLRMARAFLPRLYGKAFFRRAATAGVQRHPGGLLRRRRRGAVLHPALRQHRDSL